MHHPFLDVGRLSDEEIVERLGKAYMYMNAQVSLGHTPTVASIKDVIQALEAERQQRIQAMMDEEQKRKYPDFNKPIDIGTIEE